MFGPETTQLGEIPSRPRWRKEVRGADAQDEDSHRNPHDIVTMLSDSLVCVRSRLRACARVPVRACVRAYVRGVHVAPCVRA